MATVSTFELLIKPLIPPMFDEIGSGRTVVQGYFLTIANIGNSAVSLRLRFTAITPTLTPSGLAAFYDIAGSNPSPPVPTPVNNSVTFTIDVPANDTGLFILQPKVDRPLLAAANTEVRGFVDISLSSPIGNNAFSLLLTPEHRGTFLPKDIIIPPTGPVTTVSKDFDQLVYALPTAEGKALYTLRQFSVPTIPIQPIPIPSVPTPIPVPSPIPGPGPIEVSRSGELEQILTMMMERIEELSQARTAVPTAFIPEVAPQTTPVMPGQGR